MSDIEQVESPRLFQQLHVPNSEQLQAPVSPTLQERIENIQRNEAFFELYIQIVPMASLKIEEEAPWKEWERYLRNDEEEDEWKFSISSS